MPEFPLPLAKECMREYNTLMKGEDVAKMHDAFTDTITFNTSDLAQWLRSKQYLDNTENIRICMGIYTPEAAETAGKLEYEGRVTAFICPMRNGEEIDCFNGGNTGP